MCVYVHIYSYIHVYRYEHVCMYEYMCIYTHALCSAARGYVCIHILWYICAYILITRMCLHIEWYICVQWFRIEYMCSDTSLNTCVHVYNIKIFVNIHWYLWNIHWYLYQYTRMHIESRIHACSYPWNQLIETYAYTYSHSRWQWPTGGLKLHVIFRKRATNCKALLRKIIYKDKASYGSWPPWIYVHTKTSTGWRRPVGYLISCRSFFAKEPLTIGLFCGKWAMKIRHPIGLCHLVRLKTRAYV